MADIPQLVTDLRATFESGVTRPVEWRRAQLAALKSMLLEQDEDFVKALYADLGKPADEARGTELMFVVNEIDHTLEHLEAWLAPEPAPLPSKLLPGTAQVIREPLGVALVIGPWNYPLHLALAPMVGIIAAGNVAVVKPSELSPTVSAAIGRHLPAYLDASAFAVVQGGIPETTELLEQRFDHIFYTGNGAVGTIVMTAAAKHLTPVALELGGKSPVIVDPAADPALVAGRLVRAKFLNAGQTCVAPDYVLAIGDSGPLEAALTAEVRRKFGDDPSVSPEYGRIVNERHFDRLSGLLGSGRVVTGGETDEETKYIAPTVLADVAADSPVMGEEIFGPILPILTVASLDEALAFIRDRDKPLALYAFTDSDEVKHRILTETSSGAVGFGHPVVHLTATDLPFGGVGASGMGRYHGKYSIDTFSHLKAVLDRPL
ncbi:aldehyde dehydrogenase family protein [Kribbella sp. NPDC055071]